MSYEICLKFYNDVYKYLLTITKNSYLAEELTQETFYKALVHYRQITPDDKTKAWLLVIARNGYYNHLRYMKKIADIEIEEAMSKNVEKIVDNVDNLQETHSRSLLARKLVHDLRDDQKEIFFWRVYGDLSFKQISEIFGESESCVYGKYYKAKQKILRHIEKAERNK